MSRLRTLGLVLFFLASPAFAGWSMTQVVTGTGGRGAGAMDSRQKVWTDGVSGKVEYETSNNPMMGKGSYLLILDGGRKMFMVNPKQKTYSRFDLMGMTSGMDAMGGGGPGGMEMKIEDPKMEKVLEEAGGDLLGYPTTHYRYHTTYTMTIAMPMMKSSMATDIVEDVWTSAAVDFGGTGRAMAQLSGGGTMKELAKLDEQQRAKQVGTPLKRIVATKSKSTSKGGMAGGMLGRMMGGGGTAPSGGDATTTTTTEIRDLVEVALPASTFQIPAGYAETEMMQRGPAMPDLGEEEH